jgi:hypothetical protein
VTLSSIDPEAVGAPTLAGDSFTFFWNAPASALPPAAAGATDAIGDFGFCADRLVARPRGCAPGLGGALERSGLGGELETLVSVTAARTSI